MSLSSGVRNYSIDMLVTRDYQASVGEYIEKAPHVRLIKIRGLPVLISYVISV